jgi:hypothetical protein
VPQLLSVEHISSRRDAGERVLVVMVAVRCQRFSPTRLYSQTRPTIVGAHGSQHSTTVLKAQRMMRRRAHYLLGDESLQI